MIIYWMMVDLWVDVSIHEVIEGCPLITNTMIENLEYFNYSIEELKNNYMNVLNSKDLINYTTDIDKWLKNSNEEYCKSVSKNANYLKIISEETEKLKTLQNSIQQEIAKNEKIIEMLREDLSNINRKKESLADIRDEIQMCKLLTNTSFSYKGSSISGYVVGKQIECFELDPEKLSKNDITNSLYNKLKKYSHNIKK